MAVKKPDFPEVSLQNSTILKNILLRPHFTFVIFLFSAAWFSQGFYHYDEHFQILEFLGHKLSWIAPELLQWEFKTQSRSFFQPFLYFLIAKPLILLGIDNPHTLAFTFRLLNAALFFVGFNFYLSELDKLKDNFNQQRRVKILCSVFFLLPFIAVRTSSETLTMIATLFAVAFALKFAKSKDTTAILLAGIFSGISFAARYQAGVMTVGLVAWLFVFTRPSFTAWVTFFSGLIFVIFVEHLINHWGYGGWPFVPWRYFDYQVIRGVAAGFGASPWYYFFNLTIEEFGIISAICGLMLGLAATLRHWKSITVWTVLPFLAVHSLMAHKELRFIFPVFILLTPFVLHELIEIFLSNRSRFPRAAKFIFVIAVIANIVMHVNWTFSPQKEQIAIAKVLDQYEVSSFYCVHEDLHFIKPLSENWYRSHDPRKRSCTMASSLAEIQQGDVKSAVYIRFSDIQEYLNYERSDSDQIIYEDGSNQIIRKLNGLVPNNFLIKVLKGKPLRLLVLRNSIEK